MKTVIAMLILICVLAGCEKNDNIVKDEKNDEVIQSISGENNAFIKQEKTDELENEKALISADVEKLVLNDKITTNINNEQCEIYFNVDHFVIDAGNGFTLSCDYSISLTKDIGVTNINLENGIYTVSLEDFYDENILMEYYMNEELSVDKIDINDIDFKFYISIFEDYTTNNQYLCLTKYEYENVYIDIWNNSFEKIFEESASNYVSINMDEGVFSSNKPVELYTNQILFTQGEYIGYDETIEKDIVRFDYFNVRIDDGVVKKVLNGEDDIMTYESITAEEAKKIMDTQDDFIILDVRTDSEYEEGHIENAILIPDYEMSTKAEELLKDKNQLILVYCRSGRRSKNASEILASLGYANVKEFGGIIDWKYEIVID